MAGDNRLRSGVRPARESPAEYRDAKRTGHVLVRLVSATAETLAEAYAKLGAGATEVFPIRYATEVPLETGRIEGNIAGFFYLLDKRTGWLSKTRSVEAVT